MRLLPTNSDTRGRKPKRSPLATKFELALQNSYKSYPRIGSAELLAGYTQFPWLRAVVDKIAEVGSTVDWFATDDRGNPIGQHPITNLLMTGNQYMDGVSFRRLSIKYICLVGELFWLKERNRLGMPIALWPIPPHWVQALPITNNGKYMIRYQRWQTEIPDSEIVHIYEADPLLPYARGSGAGSTLADELETDEFAAKHLKTFFRNSARPDLLIYSDDPENPLGLEDAVRLETKWVQKLQGFWRAHRPFFMPGKVGVQTIGSSLKDLGMPEIRKFERDVILQVYGMPPEALGVLERSNRATIESAEFFLTKHVVNPKLRLLKSGMQSKLVPDFDRRIRLDYTSPILEDKEHTLNVMGKFEYAFTLDEIRGEAGTRFRPLPNKDGERYAIPLKLFFSDDHGPESNPNLPKNQGNASAQGAQGGKALPPSFGARASECLRVSAEHFSEVALLSLGVDPEEIDVGVFSDQMNEKINTVGKRFVNSLRDNPSEFDEAVLEFSNKEAIQVGRLAFVDGLVRAGVKQVSVVMDPGCDRHKNLSSATLPTDDGSLLALCHDSDSDCQCFLAPAHSGYLKSEEDQIRYLASVAAEINAFAQQLKRALVLDLKKTLQLTSGGKVREAK